MLNMLSISCYARMLRFIFYFSRCTFIDDFTFFISDCQWVFCPLLRTPRNAGVSQKCHLCYRQKWLHDRQKNGTGNFPESMTSVSSSHTHPSLPRKQLGISHLKHTLVSYTAKCSHLQKCLKIHMHRLTLLKSNSCPTQLFSWVLNTEAERAFCIFAELFCVYVFL